MNNKTKKLALMSLYISIALMLNIFENFLPTRYLVPGAKLGLANVITMISLLTLGKKDTIMILVIRVLLGSIFGGGVSGFLYSISGSIFSFMSMTLIISLFKDKISMIGISATGAFFHSVGQVLMASIIIQNVRIFSYLPMLLFASIVTGVFVGYTAKNTVEFMVKIKKMPVYNGKLMDYYI